MNSKTIVIVDNYGKFEHRQDRLKLLTRLLIDEGEKLGLPVRVYLVAAERRFRRQLPTEADAFVITGSLETPSRQAIKSGWMQEQSQWLRKIIRGRDSPPILGICFGHQLIGTTFGSNLQARREPEIASRRVLKPTRYGVDDPLVRGERLPIICNHDYQLSRIPDGFVQVAWSEHPASPV